MMTLTSRDWRRLLTMNGELAELSEESPAAGARHALSSISALAGAEECFVVFGVLALPDRQKTDPLLGWRPVQALYEARAEERVRAAAQWCSEPARLVDDVLMRRLLSRVANARSTRTFIRRELVSERCWKRNPYVAEFLGALGVCDRIQSVRTIASEFKAAITLERVGRKRAFDERQRDLAHAAMDNLGWYFRRLARQLALLGPEYPQLSTRETETLNRLLAGGSERSIAHDMGLATATVHQYVTSIYRKLNVNSRPALMARFGRRTSSLNAPSIVVSTCQSSSHRLALSRLTM